MRFLIDENLSPRLVVALRDAYPGSTHVEALQLRGRDDASVWAAARDGGYMVLTKDDDCTPGAAISHLAANSFTPTARMTLASAT